MRSAFGTGAKIPGGSGAGRIAMGSALASAPEQGNKAPDTASRIGMARRNPAGDIKVTHRVGDIAMLDVTGIKVN